MPTATIPIPWDGIDNVIPNIRKIYKSPTKEIIEAAWNAFVASGVKLEVIPDTPIVGALPDWDGLLNRLLSEDLYPLFKSITNAAFSNPVLLVARNDIYGAISNPAIIDRISALKAGLDMLLASGYEVSPEDKNLWNQTIAELNFPDEVRL